MGVLGSLRCRAAGIACLLALCPGLAAGEPQAPAGTAAVRGTISVPSAGPTAARSPAATPYSGVAAAHAHGAGAPSRGPHETVVISLHPVSFTAAAAPLAEPPRLEQTGMAFVPRVLPVTVGTTIHIVNLDHVFHNVFSLTPGARFDIGHRRTGEVAAQRIDIAGRIEVFCDIHPDMVATILSLDTPYFTRPDSSGRYEFGNLPPGAYEARAFHPAYAYPAVRIELTVGAVAAADFAPAP